MKKIIIIVGLLLHFTAFAASKEVVATVRGMVCGFCAQGITKKLETEPSVEKVDVSLEKKLVTVKLKEGKDLADQSLEKIERH